MVLHTTTTFSIKINVHASSRLELASGARVRAQADINLITNDSAFFISIFAWNDERRTNAPLAAMQ